jgi:hypothetical protein
MNQSKEQGPRTRLRLQVAAIIKRLDEHFARKSAPRQDSRNERDSFQRLPASCENLGVLTVFADNRFALKCD